MKIRSFAHKGLKRLYLQDNPKGLPADTVDKLRKMLAFLQEMGEIEELKAPPRWKAHTLTRNRKGIWTLAVTPNWRLTFGIDTDGKEIFDIDFEDYH